MSVHDALEVGGASTAVGGRHALTTPVPEHDPHLTNRARPVRSLIPMTCPEPPQAGHVFVVGAAFFAMMLPRFDVRGRGVAGSAAPPMSGTNGGRAEVPWWTVGRHNPLARRRSGRHPGHMQGGIPATLGGTVELMTEPNSTLRAVRMSLMLSQDELARVIREAGARLGAPNDCSKRHVQRWESGLIGFPRPVYARALEVATGLPIASLGFRLPVPQGRLDDAGGVGGGSAPVPAPMPAPRAQRAGFAGVWLSRYEYPSSSRGATFVGQHYVLLLQHADRLTVRSLPDSADGELSMDLTVDGHVITGTWVEVTAAAGHYRGARYHGAIQLLADPTGRRLAGKWLGFGQEMDVNTGPWELIYQDASTSMKTLEEYNRRPSPA